MSRCCWASVATTINVGARHAGIAMNRLEAVLCQLRPSAAAATSSAKSPHWAGEGGQLRAGIVGLDTSHSVAFVRALNAADPPPEFAGTRVVAASKRGTGAETFRIAPLIASSSVRIPGYSAEVEALGVEVMGDTSSFQLGEMLEKVDVVFLETNDGNPRLEQAVQVLRAGKPMFIDKPVAKDLPDTLAIYALAKALGVPVFSSSSLRWAEGAQAARRGELGDVLGCDSFGPAHHETELNGMPSLFWYGVHGCEMLFTAMGTGCETVAMTSTQDTDVCVGTWADGRVGTFRGSRVNGEYGGTVHGSEGEGELGPYLGYEPMLAEILSFFRTGEPPVSDDETLEIYGFMCAAEESKNRGGVPVSIAEVMDAAKRRAQLIIDDAWYTPGTMRAVERIGTAAAAPFLSLADGEMLPREIRGFGVNSEDWGTHGNGAGGGVGPASEWWQIAKKDAEVAAAAEEEEVSAVEEN
jgi:predicted dehydrogenase